jgi:hypothetical protein
MITLIIGTFVELPHSVVFIVSVVLGGGFVLSLLYGMLYKIVPFMTWFHLSNMGYFNVPMMREMVPEKRMRVQFILHFLSLLFIALGYFDLYLMQIGAVLFTLSSVVLFYNLLGPILIYTEIRKEEPMSWEA